LTPHQASRGGACADNGLRGHRLGQQEECGAATALPLDTRGLPTCARTRNVDAMPRTADIIDDRCCARHDGAGRRSASGVTRLGAMRCPSRRVRPQLALTDASRHCTIPAEARRHLLVQTPQGTCLSARSREMPPSSSSTSRAIIDASVVLNSVLNLKHRRKWFAPMRQFVDRRGRDWSCEVPSEVRCKRRECGHARNRLWMIGSKRVPCD
jgi:hypothetical protein